MTMRGDRLIQGQGHGTIRKEECLRYVTGMNLSVLTRSQKWKRPYFHVDLMAGKGWNDKCNHEGSPLAFLNAAAEHLPASRISALFCDREYQHIVELTKRIGDQPRFVGYNKLDFLCADNSKALPQIADWIAHADIPPEFASGSILIDGNGFPYRTPDGEGPPLYELHDFLLRHLRMDVIMVANMRAYRLMRGAEASGRATYRNLMTPHELMRFLHKKHWQVAQISLPGKGHDFLMFIGRNYPVREGARMGIFDVDSQHGQRIIRDASSQHIITASQQIEMF